MGKITKKHRFKLELKTTQTVGKMALKELTQINSNIDQTKEL